MNELPERKIADFSTLDAEVSDMLAKRRDEEYLLWKRLYDDERYERFYAFQPAMSRWVRIKIEKCVGSDANRDIFEQARLLGSVEHPLIQRIYDFARDQVGRTFMVVPLHKERWSDMIHELDLQANLRIFRQVAETVSWAHETLSVFHRDIKPQVIWLEGAQTILTGWSMARPINFSNLAPGGSPAYIAPEMALHKLDKIGPASDIYLLGATLFQVLNGKPPHPGSTVQELLRNAAKNVIVDQACQHPLMKVVMRCLATEPADRYASAQELIDALDEHVDSYK